MPTEADTCRTLITPKLLAAGWDSESHSLTEQRFFTDGRIIVRGSTCTRRKGKRAEILCQVPAQTGQPDADPFDLLCHLAFYAPVSTRWQCVDRLKKLQAAFFDYFAPEAREILSALLEKYAADGELQFTLPDALKVPPISQHGNVNDIIGKFDSADQLRTAGKPPYH